MFWSADSAFGQWLHRIWGHVFVFPYGLPRFGGEIRSFRGFLSIVDRRLRCPVYVAEHLTPKTVAANRGNRKFSQFHSDPTVPPPFRVANEDFRATGMSRGHMAAAANHKTSQSDMDETFNLSFNIVPQDLSCNAEYWNRMEWLVRDLTKVFPHVRVISGPLWIPQKDGQMQYRVCGDHMLSVPTHLFKVIIAETRRKYWFFGPRSVYVGAFIVPNAPIDRRKPLVEFQVPLSDIERHSGMEMLPRLRPVQMENLCAKDGCCQLVDPDVQANEFLRRDISRAASVADVEKCVSNFLKAGGILDHQTAMLLKEKREKKE